MIRNLYDWTLRMAGSKQALPSLFAVSFAESSFFPIPPDVMMVPMVLARRDLAWKIAAVCTVGSVLGGIFGYLIGYYLYDTFGAWLIHLYGLDGKAEQFHDWYAKWGAALILAKGLTPIPFKLVTIVSGLAKFNFGLFVLTAAVTRALRFFIIAALLRQFGEPIQAFIEKRLTLVMMTFLAAIVGGFMLVAALG